MQLSSQECDRTLAPFNTVQRFILTPSSTTTPAPIVTLGPMVQFSPICAVGSCRGAAEGRRRGQERSEGARYQLDRLDRLDARPGLTTRTLPRKPGPVCRRSGERCRSDWRYMHIPVRKSLGWPMSIQKPAEEQRDRGMGRAQVRQ